MLNTTALDDLAKKIGQAIDASPAKDVEKNIKALLQASLQRLDLVPREEFELQTQVLLGTRDTKEDRTVESPRPASDAAFPPGWRSALPMPLAVLHSRALSGFDAPPV